MPQVSWEAYQLTQFLLAQQPPQSWGVGGKGGKAQRKGKGKGKGKSSDWTSSGGDGNANKATKGNAKA